MGKAWGRIGGGAASLALLLSGCGTVAAGTRTAAPTLVPVTLTEGPVSVRGSVPVVWTRTFVLPGAGDGMWIGSTQNQFALVVGNPYHWEPSHAYGTTWQGRYTWYQPLGGHNYAVVTVPAGDKSLAQRIGQTIHMVKGGQQ